MAAVFGTTAAVGLKSDIAAGWSGCLFVCINNQNTGEYCCL